jgi:glycosyltransferase involved in cell wall biosynthesis
MMKGRGHTLYHYGHEDSDTLADEDVTVMTNTVWKDVYGTHDHRNNMFKYNTNDAVYKTFYENTIREIQKRKQPRDIILPFWGAGVRPICDAHKDLIVIEPGIGYADGHWANYKVFESYAMYHAYCGLDSVRNCQQNNYDIVIPNYFDTDEFEYRDDKEEYFLFVGRVYSGKGIHIVLQVAEATGIMLKIARQVDEHYRDYKWPSFVEFLG